jgi:hypothetical protein
MKYLILIALSLILPTANISSFELRLIGFIPSAINVRVIDDGENSNRVGLEMSTNAEYSVEQHKFYVTNTDHKEIDIKAYAFSNTKGKIRHEVALDYLSSLARDDQQVIFNIATN